MPSWKHAWIALVLAGCGSAGKPVASSGGGGGGGDSTGCEPGRCLDDISKQIQERKAEARACYDALSTQKRGAKGRLIINFRIDADGNVTETSQGMQEDQITDETLVGCVGDVIKSVKFAKSPSGKATRAYHQFEFTAR
ncbi:MAG TPA: AgmX/PglI C-terminal domain-containing protein [Kofleriaceae bacterium]